MSSEKPTVQPLYQSDSAALILLSKPNILWLTWQKKAPSAIIQEVYEQLFRHMQHLQVKHILIDIRQRGRATDADETWMMQEFAPRLMQQFKEGIYLAYLLGAQHYQELKEESPNGTMESLSHLLSLHYFREEQSALAWLGAKNQPVIL
ncbi:hypothetical protein AAE02nite_32340 [Adhaeribacter aerolatus]|uniref:STAS/SEC14 domain-containing protein n=1 Tax=Adhaeribacter aerolatus TaxID=670289 RepID=A0A512B0T2_9BACT|nr:hypothetical protein [Adhaeribacter aerolatus]GEO05570.1 hypothetical protein AAE02nite_32340 [Adhaeribacter aerolatus]